MTTTVVAFLAGVLSVLSPCVLPLLPMVLGAAVSEHRFGPAALAAGLALSFTAIGLFIALFGFGLGVSGDVFRYAAAIVMMALGAVLMAPVLQARVAVVAGPLSNWTEQRFGSFSSSGLPGQFGVGLLLGAVWSPCVGPTLGAASILAARGENLASVAFTMMAFGVGAGLPLLLLGFASRELLMRWRGRLMTGGKAMKTVMGAFLVIAGAAVLSGFDKTLEAWLNRLSPAWLLDVTTRF